MNLLGRLVRIISHNENYGEYKGQLLRVTHVAYSIEGHPGYDESLKGQALVDLETLAGKPVPFSLYRYEFIIIN